MIIRKSMLKKDLTSKKVNKSSNKNAKKSLNLKKALPVTGYAIMFVATVAFMSGSYQDKGSDSVLANGSSKLDSSVVVSAKLDSVDTSVDKVVAINIVANVANDIDLPVASNVSSLSQSLVAESTLNQTSDDVIEKPAMVVNATGGREAVDYEVKDGERLRDIAEAHGISLQTLKWANNIDNEGVESGDKITIPPVDGVIYKVKSGDTVESIAEKYKVSVEALVTYNDLEVDGLKSGQEIVLLGGVLPTDERPGYEDPSLVQSTAQVQVSTPSVTANPYVLSTDGSVGISASNNYLAQSVGNRYAFGNCTWYAYERRAQLGKPIGSFWGNAATWAYYAQSAGFAVGGTPKAGAIMQNGGGYGHVAIVESVNPGESIVISEMNGYRFGGGFNVIGRGTIPWSDAVSGYYQYIY